MTCSSSGHALTYNKMRKFKYAEPNLNLTKKMSNWFLYLSLHLLVWSLVKIYSKVNAVPYLHKKGRNCH